ncbi:integrase, catalytic region, zinc finger, CCHC-type containing protein [Tanacetum coccineum]
MSTSNTHQQSLDDAGSETRPSMLERGSYIPWASRFRRYLNQKRENRKWLNMAIDEGPYEFRIFTSSKTEAPRMQKEEDLRGDDLKHYEAEIEAMNLISISIPNDIYALLQKLCGKENSTAILCHASSSLVDYDDDYQGDVVQNNSEDLLTSEMILLTRAITHHFFNLKNNRLCTSSNTRNQAIIQGDKRTLQTTSSGTAANVQCYNCSEKGHYARNCQKLRVQDSKYFIEQMLLAKQDEVGVILTDKQNDFHFADASRIEETEELTKLENAKKGKSVNTKFGKDIVSHNLLCVTPLNKPVFQQKIVAPKTKEKHVLSKTVTLQTSPNKQQAVETNTNVIAPGMYKVEKTQNINTNKAKSVLSSTGLRAISSVRRPSNRDSSLKNSILFNTKNLSEKVEVSDRSNKKLDVVFKDVDSHKKIVTNADIKNTLIAKNVLYVTCAKNVLIPCHDDCLAKYKVNVHSKVRRALFTTSRTAKSKFKDHTPVISKTRFSIQTIQSKSLDTTPVVSKTKIIVVTPLSAKYKVVQIILWIVDSGCSKHMTADRSLLKNFVEKFIGTVRFRNDHFAAIIGYEVAFPSKTCYVQNLEGDDLLTGDCESNLYTISISDMAASSPIMSPKKTTTPMSNAAIKALVARSVADALAEHEANRSRNRDDSHDSGSGERRMESVFHISNYTIENQVKFVTCNLIGVSLTWWNSHVKTVGHDAAYGMPWKTLMKMMTDKYGPHSEIKKLEIEI